MNNTREGKYWKLDIWKDKIVVRNGSKNIQVEANEHQFIGKHMKRSPRKASSILQRII